MKTGEIRKTYFACFHVLLSLKRMSHPTGLAVVHHIESSCIFQLDLFQVNRKLQSCFILHFSTQKCPSNNFSDRLPPM